METINKRIKIIIDEGYSGSVAAFEKACCIKPGTLKHVVGGRMSAPSLSTFESVVRTNSLYSPMWILTGEGLKLKIADEYNIKKNHNPVYSEKILESQEVTLYDINAAANLKTLFTQREQNILGKLSIPEMPKCDGAIYVRGDSMYPLLKSGDIIAFKEVQPSLNSIFFGEMYLLSFDMNGEEYLTAKYVQKSKKKDHIHLVSYNTNHPPMDIPLAGIKAMALIKVSIRMNTMR